MKPLIMKVWTKKFDGVKLVTIPKKHPIKAGDHVIIQKISNDKSNDLINFILKKAKAEGHDISKNKLYNWFEEFEKEYGVVNDDN